MQKIVLGVLTVWFALSAADTKPTSATYIANNDVQATIKGMPADKVTDKALRVVDTGKQNVGIGRVHRSAKATQTSLEHEQVTEVYHILAGSGTMVTGGTQVNPQRRPRSESTHRP